MPSISPSLHDEDVGYLPVFDEMELADWNYLLVRAEEVSEPSLVTIPAIEVPRAWARRGHGAWTFAHQSNVHETDHLREHVGRLQASSFHRSLALQVQLARRKETTHSHHLSCLPVPILSSQTLVVPDHLPCALVPPPKPSNASLIPSKETSSSSASPQS